jgi:glycerol-3-phosphate cytidylyltransferase
MVTGYTTGVYDLFHVGHVNLLRNAKALCDKLVVGVTVDDLVAYKGKRSVIPYTERIEVVRSCRYVDVAIPQKSIDKVDAVRKLKAKVLFVGDDWYSHEHWQSMEGDLLELGCKVIYFPYTEGTSSTLINETLQRLRYSAADTSEA